KRRRSKAVGREPTEDVPPARTKPRRGDIVARSNRDAPERIQRRPVGAWVWWRRSPFPRARAHGFITSPLSGLVSRHVVRNAWSETVTSPHKACYFITAPLAYNLVEPRPAIPPAN